MPRESLIVYIDAKKKEALRAAAKEDGRTLSGYCARVLEQHAEPPTREPRA